jgi:hypothetical protein
MIGVEFKEDILFRIELYDPSAILIRYPFFFLGKYMMLVKNG